MPKEGDSFTCKSGRVVKVIQVINDEVLLENNTDGPLTQAEFAEVNNWLLASFMLGNALPGNLTLNFPPVPAPLPSADAEPAPPAPPTGKLLDKVSDLIDAQVAAADWAAEGMTRAEYRASVTESLIEDLEEMLSDM